MADGEFSEKPAKWTGNGARSPKPDVNDWYETVKINYGVSPAGEMEFLQPDPSFAHKSIHAHYEYWQEVDVPDSWKKFKDIALYWLDKGVDGFRYDMAEMVPVAFWSYLNSHIKQVNPEALLLAEVYQPERYRPYISMGKMDYLYDKVGFYDTLKAVMREEGDVKELHRDLMQTSDIEHNLLHFIENHDEQRIASPEFAGDAMKGKPALVVSAFSNSGPMMIYFGQEVGEDGSESLGFGNPSRTSIFDYGGVPAHQRWMNNGAFDGGQLSSEERGLREYYKKVLTAAASHDAVKGEYVPLSPHLTVDGQLNDPLVFAFARSQGKDKIISVSNFYSKKTVSVSLVFHKELMQRLQLQPGTTLKNILDDATVNILPYQDGVKIKMQLPPLGSFVLE